MLVGDALEQTIDALEADNRLLPEHAALVAMARGLAGAVEADPGNAALWKEYRTTLAMLTTLDSGTDNDDVAHFLSAVRTAVANPPDAK